MMENWYKQKCKNEKGELTHLKHYVKDKVVFCDFILEKYKEWYDYDKDGNLIETINSNGYKCKRIYDKSRDLVLVKDNYGNISTIETNLNIRTHISEDENGKVIYSVDISTNKSHTEIYDSNGNLIKVKENDNIMIENMYNDSNRLIKSYDWDRGYIHIYEYEPLELFELTNPKINKLKALINVKLYIGFFKNLIRR